jgi:hypothetical protein
VSRVAELIDQGLRQTAPAIGKLALATVQRRVSRRLLTEAAMHFRNSADLLDEAAALLPEPKKGDPAT